MKKIFLFMLFVACSITNAQEKNKEVVTVTFKVRGNCEECKSRIENATDIKGVKLAVWDKNAQSIKVTYRTDKVTEEQIKQAILKSGHDVNDQKADSLAYDKLPKCCKYRDKKCDK
jgi:mercuric ion binding protein